MSELDLNEHLIKLLVEYDPDAVTDKLLEVHGSGLLIRHLIEWTSLPELLEDIAVDCRDQEAKEVDKGMEEYWSIARTRLGWMIDALDEQVQHLEDLEARGGE